MEILHKDRLALAKAKSTKMKTSKSNTTSHNLKRFGYIKSSTKKACDRGGC